MDIISNELRKISRVGAEAMNWVELGQWRKARRALKKIRNSFCIIDKERVCCFIEASILSHQGKHEEAAMKIRENLHAVWGYIDAFKLMNRINPQVTEESLTYILTVQGRNSLIGDTDRFACEYEIIARSYEEAVSYIADLGIYPKATELNVIDYQVSFYLDEQFAFQGIADCGSFELINQALSQFCCKDDAHLSKP